MKRRVPAYAVQREHRPEREGLPAVVEKTNNRPRRHTREVAFIETYPSI